MHSQGPRTVEHYFRHLKAAKPMHCSYRVRQTASAHESIICLCTDEIPRNRTKFSWSVLQDSQGITPICIARKSDLMHKQALYQSCVLQQMHINHGFSLHLASYQTWCKIKSPHENSHFTLKGAQILAKESFILPFGRVSLCVFRVHMVSPLPPNAYNFDGTKPYRCIQSTSMDAFPSRADSNVFSKSDLFKEVLLLETDLVCF